MNMFKPTKAKTVKEYLDAVPAEKKEIILFLHSFIRKAVPKLKPYFATNMIGYGTFMGRNYKHEPLEWPIISLAYRAHYISMYVCSTNRGVYVAEKYKNKLGKVKVGKSCINIKKLEDVHLSTLQKVLKEAEKNPGLTHYSK